MTPEQLKHYLNGGKFTAIYNPKKLDIADKSIQKIGQRITVYQNILNMPINLPKWEGQFRFNSPSIYGWFPEEDIQDLLIVDDYIDKPSPTKTFMYRLTYTKQESLFPNFGKGDWKAPMTVYREYNDEMDDYIMQLSKPQADKIEKAELDMLKGLEIDWKIIHEEK